MKIEAHLSSGFGRSDISLRVADEARGKGGLVIFAELDKIAQIMRYQFWEMKV